MNLIQRWKNLWKLSEYEAGTPRDESTNPGTQIITLIKKPDSIQKAIFIPRIKVSPVDKITKE